MNPIVPVWLVFLAVMAYLYQRETQWFSRFNVFTVFVVGMLLRYGIAVPFSDDVNAKLSKISLTQSQLVEYYVAVALAWIIVLATVFCLRRLPGGSYLASTVAFGNARRPGWTASSVAVVVAVALTGIVAVVFIVIPWSQFSQGFTKILAPTHTATDYFQHRAAYSGSTTYAVSVLNYVGGFVRWALMPAVIWILFFQRSRSSAVKVALAAAILVLAAIGVNSGEKSATLLLVVGFGVALVVANGSRSIFTWRMGIAALVMAGVVVPLLYHLQYPTQTYQQLLMQTVNRLTVEYSRTAQLRFAFYPDRHPFLLGLGSFVVRTILQIAQIRTGSTESPETYIPTHSPGNAGYQSTWNAGFFAEGWADFGWVGVVATSILVGVVLVGIEKWFHGGPKGPLQLGTYTAVCVASFSITDVNLTTALWGLGTLTSFAVYWLFRLFPADSPPRTEGIAANSAGAQDRSTIARMPEPEVRWSQQRRR